VSEVVAFVSRLLGFILAGIGLQSLAEWARFGVMTHKGEPMTAAWSAGLVVTLFLLAFLLAFGGAKQ